MLTLGLCPSGTEFIRCVYVFIQLLTLIAGFAAPLLTQLWGGRSPAPLIPASLHPSEAHQRVGAQQNKCSLQWIPVSLPCIKPLSSSTYTVVASSQSLLINGISYFFQVVLFAQSVRGRNGSGECGVRVCAWALRHTDVWEAEFGSSSTISSPCSPRLIAELLRAPASVSGVICLQRLRAQALGRGG